MNKVCDKFCGGRKPYELKKFLMISVPFLFAGFLLLMMYNFIFIRYGIAALVLIAAVIERKNLICITQKLIEVKKK